MMEKSMKTMAAGGLSAVALAIAAAVIAQFEGLRTTPYRDPVGILTVCYGHTGKDIQQRKYTPAECMAIMRRDVAKHAEALKCVKTTMDERMQIAFISLAYNIGAGNFCSSTAVKRANAGDRVGACEAIERWTKARKNGRLVTLPGLVNRRAYERAICEGDDAAALAVAQKMKLNDLAQAVFDLEAYEEAQNGEN